MHHKSVLLRAYAAVVFSCVAAWPAGSALAATQAIQATEVLDIDGNGTVDAMTDALLIFRYTFGLRGQALIKGAVGNGATRTTADQIEAYLANLTTTLPGTCSIVGSPSSSAASPVAPGTSVQLTATCTTGAQPISYSWNTGAVTPSINVSPQANTTYTVTPSNATGTGTPFSLTVYAGAIALPSNCSIAQTPNTAQAAVAAGTSVALNLTCGGGAAPTSCSWNNGIGSTSCLVNVLAPASTTTYSATASNSGGTSALVSSTVNVTVPGQGQITNYCTGPGDEIIGVEWPALGQSKSYAYGFKNQRFALKIIVPNSPPADPTRVGSWRMAEVPGTAVVSRDVTVSKNPCDFQSGQYLYSGIGNGDTAPSVYYTVNNPNYQQTGASLNINPGDTVYINLRNQVNGNNTCPYAGCDILLDFTVPK